MQSKEIAKTLHPLERAVLPVLKQGMGIKEVEEISRLRDVEVMRALQWLENKKAVKLKHEIKEIISLDINGILYQKTGLPERRLLESLPATLQELKEKLSADEINIAIGLLKKEGAIRLGKKIEITDKGKQLLQQQTSEELFLKKLPIETSGLTKEEKTVYEALKRRRQIIKIGLVKTGTVELTGLGLQLQRIKPETGLLESLTPVLLKNGAWKGKKFRHYDVEINVPRIYYGRRHFVSEAIRQIKRIWIGLGFKEMSGPLVQTSFWNFDALFVPQDHPARELQDTFFLKEPEFGKLPNDRVVENVAKTHENGWTTGSIGWKYKWNRSIAGKLVLRTHNTALSARTIAELKTSELPAKFFSVSRIFRNETLDWAHLFELHQVEGIVIDENANFRHLLGYLKEYYNKLGITKIRFRPSYYPYTELSVDTIVYNPEKRTWIELGGAGIFRPEVVKPLLGRDIPVLAWGQGLERSIVEYYGIKDIRDIYKNNLKQLKEVKEWLR